MAFTKQSSVQVWIDLASRLLMTDAGSQSKADEVITALVSALPGLPLTLLQTTVSPQVAMTQWLTAESPEEWPVRLSVERECELKSNDEEKSVIHPQPAERRIATTSHKAEAAREAGAQQGQPRRLLLTEALQLKKTSGRCLRWHLGRQGRRL
jgi:recombination associated protein RdgC